MQSFSDATGYGDWSPPMAFTVDVPLPGIPVPVSPTGIVTTNTPTYVWDEADYATRYRLVVEGAGGDVIDRLYSTSVCVSGTCSVTPTTTLADGEHAWKVRAENSAGDGDWSIDTSFMVDAVPNVPELVSPSGTVTTRTPAYVWNEVDLASEYTLSVTGSSISITQTYEASSVCTAGTCSVTPVTALDNGDYSWKIRAANSYGTGPWSDTLSFSVSVLPDAATLISPTGAIRDSQPTYSWNVVENTTAYYVQVNGPSGVVLGQWFDAIAICNEGVCSVEQPATLEAGDYDWQVQTQNSAGDGPWSAPASFSFQPIIVNTTTDTDDGSCDATHCTLREAINLANTTAGRDAVWFDIPGSGPHTIQPLSALPTITDPIIIDATTEPDFADSPVIELSGDMAGTSSDGLSISTGDSIVRGLVINRFWSGIRLTTGSSNVIEGNYIGTDVTGLLKRANRLNGIYIINSFNNTIGGIRNGTSNVISGNNNHGIEIVGSSATGNTIVSNLIGTDRTGSVVLSNGDDGIYLGDNTNQTLIGGTVAGARNIISGNSGAGIFIFEGSHVIQGNFIGTDIEGTRSLGNSSGIYIMMPEHDTTLIGGVIPGAGNLISGNGGNGITIGGNYSSKTTIQGNLIGTDITGILPLGNSQHGIQTWGSYDNTIGGLAAGAGNTVAFNGRTGIYLYYSTYPAYHNSIRSNAIFENGELGIDLYPTGINPNDPGDTDSAGVNDLQNFPVLGQAITDEESIFIQGTLNSKAFTTFHIEFFSSTTCDPSGYGEGETYLGSADVTTNGSGNTSFSMILPTAVSLGHSITATATDPGGSTSEFSACLAATASELTLLSPANNATIANGMPGFDWEDVSGATEYQIQIDDNPDFSSPEIDDVVVSSAYALTASLMDGTYYWHVRAADSGGEWGDYSIVWVMTIDTTAPAAPTLIAPVDALATRNTTLSFAWDDVAGASHYQLQVDDNAGFSDPIIDTTITASTYTPASALDDGVYYWRVRAEDAVGNWSEYSSIWSVTIDTVPPEAPVLVSPTEGSTVADNTPTFDWNDVTGAAQYQIQVDDNADFSSRAVDFTTISSTHTTYLVLANGTYYWRVRAQDTAGNWSSYSAAWTVVIDAIPPSAPDLIAPSDGLLVKDNTPNFDWGSVTGVTQYQIQVDDTSGFTSPEVDTTTIASTYTLPSALADGTYYWHVRASDGLWSDYSSTWTVIVDTSPPAAPSDLVASAVSQTQIDLSWVINSIDESNIRVERSDDGTSSWTQIGIITDDVYSDASLSCGQTRYYRVRAYRSSDGRFSDYSNVASATTASCLPAPVLVLPPDGSTIADSTLTFDWEDVAGAAEYQIQVDDDTSFTNPTVDEMVTSSTYSLSSALPDGTYYWHVRASNGLWSAYSDAWTVTIMSGPPGAAMLTSPAGGETVESAPVTYTWNEVAEATYYYLWVNNASGTAIHKVWYTTGAVCSGGVCSVTPSVSYNNGDYSWWIQTWNDYGYGPWSDAATFTFGRYRPSRRGDADLAGRRGDGRERAGDLYLG